MSDQPKTPAERWQAMVDQETEALRDELDRLYEGMTEEQIAERAAVAIAKFGQVQT